MDSLKDFFLCEVYKEIQKLGDRLTVIEPLIDWEAFRPILKGLYDNKSSKGGKSNVDPVVMVKLRARFGAEDGSVRGLGAGLRVRREVCRPGMRVDLRLFLPQL